MTSPTFAILAARILITVVAILVLLLKLFVAPALFDSVGLGLVVLALLPWLATVVSSAEFPGGWKFEFQAVKEEQRRQAQDIDVIKFLLSNFLTEDECRHLEGIASDKPYPAKQDGTTSFFEKEMRHLQALGFIIKGNPGSGVGALMRAINEAKGADVNVKDHFETTPRGRDYLRLRHEVLAGPRPS